jgi:hypothetical protein
MDEAEIIEKQPKPKRNPELIVAVLAVAIGVATMFVYIYQARIMGRQMRASSWPYLETIFSNDPTSFSIIVKNKGTGPAIIKSAVVTVDNVAYSDTQKNLDSIANMISGSRGVLSTYTNVNNRVMSPGEVINFIEVTDSTSVKLVLAGLRKHAVQFEVCYCSVFDECWTMIGNKVEPCDECKVPK